VVEALPRLQLRDVTLALGALTLAPLRLPDVVLRPRQRPPRFDHGELGLAQRAHRTVVAILGLAIALIGEALGAHRVGQLAHPPLPGRQLLLGPLRFLHQALGAARPLLERRRLQGDRLELGELGPHGVVSRGVVARRPARAPRRIRPRAGAYRSGTYPGARA